MVTTSGKQLHVMLLNQSMRLIETVGIEVLQAPTGSAKYTDSESIARA